MNNRPHRNLDVRQKAMAFAKEIYVVTDDFPKSEGFGLTSQMRRAAVSIPSNIAEGAGRRGNKEFLQFINIAPGSASELDTQLELAAMVDYLDSKLRDELTTKLTDLTKMLYGLDRSLKNNP